DRPAELLALLGVVEGVLVRRARDADGLGTNRGPGGLERRHGGLAAGGLAFPRPSETLVELLLAAEQPASGDAAVLEDHLGGVRGADAVLLELLTLADAGGAWSDDEGG